MRVFWFVFRPQMRGVNVALWHGGELLVIENAYRAGYSLPGGYIRFRERDRAAARREICEELRLAIEDRQLRRWGQLENRSEFKRDRVTYFEVRLDARPLIRIDNREVVGARIMPPGAVVTRPCTASLRYYLAAINAGAKEKAGGRGNGPSSRRAWR